MIKNEDNKLRPFNMRMPMDVWEALKLASMQEELPMAQIIIKLVRRYKSKTRMINKLDK